MTSAAPGARTTVVVVPRERFADAEAGLDSLLATVPPAVEVIYVLNGGRRSERRRIAQKVTARGGRLVRLPRSTPPNACRAEALDLVTTELVAFVDNDVVAEPGWLEPLEAAFDVTDVAAVTPLVLQRRGDRTDIHLAGGVVIETEGPTGRTFTDTHRFQGRTTDEVAEQLVAGPCDFVEYHCCVVRTDALRAIGGPDPAILGTRDHIDLSWALAANGGIVWFEPASRDSYLIPTRLRVRDVPFFLRRWSDARTRRTLDHFCAKWGVDPAYAREYSTAGRRHRLVENLSHRARRRGGRVVGAAAYRVLPRAERATSAVLTRLDPHVR